MAYFTIMRFERDVTKPRELQRKSMATLTALALVLAGCGGNKSSHNAATTTSSNPNDACPEFAVYAQNRWDPLGTAERSRPDKSAPLIGGIKGNTKFYVNGWLHTGKDVYPNNVPPFNNDVWFHFENDKGEDVWVSFGGVRGGKTTPDPGNHSIYGGPPALTPSDCEIVR